MAIKNFSSKVKPSSSMGQIQQVLSEHGAKKVSIDYDNRKPIAVSFIMSVDGVDVNFRLQVDVIGLLQAMKKDKGIRRGYCNEAQAERTAWKNKLEWLQLQMAEIETNQARIEQLLLGYAVTKRGTTLFDELKNHQQLLLNEGSYGEN